MDLDEATCIATAFASFADLERTCLTVGYIPTLRVATSEDLPTRVAKRMLARELRARGLRVAAE